MGEIASYINRQSRNNLLFTSKEVEGVCYVDIGRQLAEKIETFLQKKRLGLIAEDALKRYSVRVLVKMKRLVNILPSRILAFCLNLCFILM